MREYLPRAFQYSERPKQRVMISWKCSNSREPPPGVDIKALLKT